MADNTSTEAAKGGAIGRIVRIVGAVVDVEFPADAMPAIYNALTVKAQTPTGEVSTVLEVQTHLPGDIVRTVAMTSTDGMVRGLEATDTGSPIMMPVGKATLGRIWNVLGEPVDGKPMPEDVEWRPIHHPAPPFDTLVTTTETFETGIKVVDLHRALRQGRKDRSVRRRWRGQDRLHSGADQQPGSPSTAAPPSSPVSASAPARVTTSTSR